MTSWSLPSHPVNTNGLRRDHDAFKEATKQCKCIIRTGEASPYANIILRADCIFSDRP